MPLLVPTETFQPFYEFCHRDGRGGFRQVVEWVATLDEKAQQAFLDLLSGATRDTLTAEMEGVVAKMKTAGMDPIAEAAAAVSKDVGVEEEIVKP